MFGKLRGPMQELRFKGQCFEESVLQIPDESVIDWAVICVCSSEGHGHTEISFYS